jgi:hypothetical protein
MDLLQLVAAVISLVAAVLSLVAVTRAGTILKSQTVLKSQEVGRNARGEEQHFSAKQ